MKIVLDVKRGSKSNDFKKGDVILFNGREWYTTTKTALFGELEKRITNAITEYDKKYHELEAKYDKFLKEYTEQNSKLLPILEEILRKE